jgi:hypothetical protein
MSGLGRKVWSVLEQLGAADVNGYLMDQSVMVFADDAARLAAIPTPTAGMVTYRIDANVIEFYDGADWVDLVSSSEIDQLDDVDITGAQNLDSLVYDGTKWVNQRLNLADAGDVNLTAPGAGEYLAYDSVAGEWINDSIAIGDLSDVNAPTPLDKNSLVYDGIANEWIPYQLGVSDLVDVIVTTPNTGELLVYNSVGGNWENDDTTYQKTSEKDQADGYAGLDSFGKLDPNQIPSLAIGETFVVANQAARLALTQAETGDIAVQTDTSETYILQGTDPSDNDDWVKLLFPPAPVDSVNGQTGAVSLDTDDINEGTTNLYYTDTRVENVIASSDTDDLAEGATNLYYTDTRVENVIASSDTDDLAEGATNLYYTDARVENVIANSDTDDLAEGSTNLYYTDTRVENVIASANIDDLNDVNITTPNDGEVLTYDAMAGEWYNGAAPAGTLAGLSDVDVTGVQDGETIVYNATDGEWIPGQAGGKFVVSATAPSTPTQGDTWFNSDTGIAYIWYDDGDSAQWVQLGGGGGGGSAPEIGPITYNTNQITEDITFETGYNGVSAGPVTIASGVTVTVTSGSAWSIV